MKEAENIVHELALIDPLCAEHGVENAHKIVALIARARELHCTFHFCDSCDNVVDPGDDMCSECIQGEDDERREQGEQITLEAFVKTRVFKQDCAEHDCEKSAGYVYCDEFVIENALDWDTRQMRWFWRHFDHAQNKTVDKSWLNLVDAEKAVYKYLKSYNELPRG